MKDVLTSLVQTPRTVGALNMHMGEQNRLREFYQQGAAKMLFARQRKGAQGIYINTAGGLTGGDQLACDLRTSDQTNFTFTTQGCERVYRALDETPAYVQNKVAVQDHSVFHWLPQETLFYDGGRLDRRSTFDVSSSATALIVEPILFGRLAMGEWDLIGYLRDHLILRIDGELVFQDLTLFDGQISSQLDKPAVVDGARATALILYVSDTAHADVAKIKALLNATSGASLIRDDVMVTRLIADSGSDLRRMLAPIIIELTDGNLPKSWRL